MYFNEDNKFRPHKDVQNKIESGNGTSFDNLPFFFNREKKEISTFDKIASEEFNKISKEVSEVGELSLNQIMQNFKLISSIEKTHVKELENLAIKKVSQQFGLTKTISDKLNVKIVKSIENSDIKRKEDKKNSITCVFSIEENEIINKHVEMRKIQNSLCMGSGFRCHTTFDSIKEDLDKIDNELYPLYKKTIPNVSLFLWKLPFENLMNKVNIMGISQIKKDENKNIKAEAKAIIFPILLHETTKAAMELLFSNYIIKLTKEHGKKIADEVIKQSDVFEEEIWMKRSSSLWGYLHNVIDYVLNMKEKEITKYFLLF